MTDDRLIVALDVHSLEEAQSLVKNLGDSVSFYKVGMEVFYSVGGKIVEWLKSQNKRVFLDLKLCDIPNTTAQGLISLVKQFKLDEKDFLNVHANGGFKMMQTAAQKLQDLESKPKLIAVTILTSIDQNEWKELGHASTIKEDVIRLAKLSKTAGLDGVVASPREAEIIRDSCGRDFLIVTPGIRPAGSDVNDQSRIATPAEAIKHGATHLVIGRPIRAAENPRIAAEKILEEMNSND